MHEICRTNTPYFSLNPMSETDFCSNEPYILTDHKTLQHPSPTYKVIFFGRNEKAYDIFNFLFGIIKYMV